MNNESVLLKEIDLIQACITRMAQNSFMVKGWMISLIAVIIALLPEKIAFDVRIICVVSLVVTIAFWYLDAFFLKMEKLYRLKYEWVIQNRQKTLEYCYDLNPHNMKMRLPGIGEPNMGEIMFSKSLVPLYLLFVITELFIFLNECFLWI